MSEEEALKLLSQNGNLVKRPFLIGENVRLVGFKLPRMGGGVPCRRHNVVETVVPTVYRQALVTRASTIAASLSG